MLLAIESSLNMVRVNWLISIYGSRQSGSLPEVPEHHGGRKDHSGRVSPVGPHDIAGDMPAAWLKKSVFLEGVD